MVRKGLVLLLAGVLFTGLYSLSMAQEGGAKAAKGKKTLTVDQALAKLSLTKEQKKRIEPLLVVYRGRSRGAKDASERQNLTGEVRAQILPCLTGEQITKFEALMNGEQVEPKKEKKEGAPGK